MEEGQVHTERTSSISVSRTSKGAYSWDIKLYFNSDDTKGDIIIEELKRLNNKMQEEFKSETS